MAKLNDNKFDDTSYGAFDYQTDEIASAPTPQSQPKEASAKPKRKRTEGEGQGTSTSKRTATAHRVKDNAHRASVPYDKKAPKKKFSDVCRDPDSTFSTTVSYVTAFFGIYMLFCLVSNQQNAWLGRALSFVLLGLFSYAAYILPLIVFWIGIRYRTLIRNRALARVLISNFFAVLFLAATVYLIAPPAEPGNYVHELRAADFFNFAHPTAVSGGFLGSLLGQALHRLLGMAGAILVILLVILLYAVLCLNFRPMPLLQRAWQVCRLKLCAYLGKRKAQREARASEAGAKREARIEEYRNRAELAREERQRRKEALPPASDPAPAKGSPLWTPAVPMEEAPASIPVLPQRQQRAAQPMPPKKNRGMIADLEEWRREAAAQEASEPTEAADLCESTPSAILSDTEGSILPMVQNRDLFDEEEEDSYEPFVVTPNSSALLTEEEEDEDEEEAPPTARNELLRRTRREKAPVLQASPAAIEDEEEEPSPTPSATAPERPDYVFPPLSLLTPSTVRAEAAIPLSEDPNAIKLTETLQNFNVPVVVNHVSRGPRITRYELVPKTGIRVRSIANLVDDISMNLATAGIRIEAPIPGKAAVGVEVPNASPSLVRLRGMLDRDEFRNAGPRTTICLGADIGGDPIYTDVAKMPHLLIAGATGMGKSVCINTILTSLLYKARPDELKLILVDPKKVELGVYNNIPHLLVPVVTDPEKAAGALSWAVSEMERRFTLIEVQGVRNIKGYNQAVKDDPTKETLPQLVIVIDELADLMMSASDSVEQSICRIAQKARAAGIHLIIGTQRPSVDVVTGLIKSNIPSRIAFHVASQIDSRTILDMASAEKLLDKGDMLFYLPGVTTKPMRIQCAFVDDDEVERVTSFLKRNSTASYSQEIEEEINRAAEKCAQSGKRRADDDADEGENLSIYNDPKFKEAVDVAFAAQKISTSLLQRRLSIGFGRASKYIDAMCDFGLVSEPDGQKPREVLLTRSEYEEKMNRVAP